MSDQRTADFMRALAEGIDDALNGSARPKGYAFALFVFPFDMPEGARTNYVSNADKKDMVAALKEVVARFEGRGHNAPEGRQ